MKKIILAAAAALAVFAVVNRPIVLSDLEHLAALDQAEGHEGLKATLRSVNEGPLSVLPTAATLRLENVVAGAAIGIASDAQIASR